MCKTVQINAFPIMFSLQVLPEVILSGPVLGLILARAQITTIYRFVGFTDFVNTSLMPIKVVIGTESL
jgi:hypothetical protein